jgi:hypothetical protein
MIAAVTDLGGGRYRVACTFKSSGERTVCFTVNGQAAKCSPVAVQVRPGPADPSLCVIKNGLVSKTKVGLLIKCTVQTVDAHGNKRNVGGDEVMAELRHQKGGVPTTLLVSDLCNGAYDFELVGYVAGDFLLVVSVGGKAIAAMPQMIQFSAADACASRSVLIVPETLTSVAGEPFSFDIQTRDRFQNPSSCDSLRLSVQTHSAISTQVSRIADHTYRIICKVNSQGKVLLWAMLDNEVVGAKPIKILVAPAKVCVPKCVAWGDGLMSGRAGQDGLFWLQLKDEFGNNTDEGVEDIAVSMSSGPHRALVSKGGHGVGVFAVKYRAKMAGEYDVLVAVNQQKLPQCPLRMVVSSSATNARACVVEGLDGIATAGCELNVRLTTLDEFGNRMLVGHDHFESRLVGPAVIQTASTRSEDGMYTIGYIPTVAGHYQLSVLLHGLHVADSPYSVNVLPAASAASCSHIVGGMPSCIAGVPTRQLVQMMDTFGNKRQQGGDRLQVLVGDGSVEASVTDRNDGTYEVSFVPTKSGLHDLCVSLDGAKIRGSPYGFKVEPTEFSPLQSALSPATQQSDAAGTLVTMTLIVSDSFGNHRNPGNPVPVRK